MFKQLRTDMAAQQALLSFRGQAAAARGTT